MLFRRCSAFHESGHALVGLAKGALVTSIWLDEGGGHISYRLLPYVAAADAVICMAGPLAQCRFDFQSEVGKSDFQKLAEICDQHGADSDAMWDRYRAEAQHLVDVNWCSIVVVAAALERRGRLSGAEIAAIAQS
jgi:hypothetical protein